MRIPKGFSGILLIKKVWDGSFIIHYEDDYFHEKAKTDKAYERTAERFENDDFDVLVWNGAWWIEKQPSALSISVKIYDHISMALAKEGIYYLY